MRTVTTASSVREAVAGWRAARQSVAFVPTMGNLHAGHLSLVQLAQELAHRVVVSNYVNPCLLYTSPSPRDVEESRMPSSA